MGSNVTRACSQDNTDEDLKNITNNVAVPDGVSFYIVESQNPKLFLPADIFNTILSFCDSVTIGILLQVNKEFSNYIWCVEHRDRNIQLQILKEFIHEHLGNADSIQNLFLNKYLFENAMEYMTTLFSLWTDLKEKIVHSSILQTIPSGTVTRTPSVAKNMTYHVDEQDPPTKGTEVIFNPFSLNDNWTKNDNKLNAASDAIDFDKLPIRLIFHEKRLSTTISQLMLPETLSDALFEDPIRNIPDLEEEENESSNTWANNPIFSGMVATPTAKKSKTKPYKLSVYPALQVGPWILEMDPCGVCVPKILCHADIFDNLDNYRKKIKMNDDQILKSVCEVVAEWNTKKKEGSFVLALIDRLGMRLDPKQRLIVQEYALPVSKRQPIFRENQMVYLFNPPTTNVITSPKNVELQIQGSKYVAFMFTTHSTLDILTRKLLDSYEWIRRTPDYSLLQNYDIILVSFRKTRIVQFRTVP
jgi:hypothetical protein